MFSYDNEDDGKWKNDIETNNFTMQCNKIEK